MIAVLEDLQFNADKFHRDAGRIYGLVQVSDSGNDTVSHAAYTPGAHAGGAAQRVPRDRGRHPHPDGRHQIVRCGEMYFTRTGFASWTPISSTSFPFPGIRPSRHGALAALFRHPVAAHREKYFGRENPLGRILTINSRVSVTVTGVSRGLYENSSIQFEMLVTMDAARLLLPDLESWETAPFTTFLRLARGADPKRLNAKLPGIPAQALRRHAAGPQAAVSVSAPRFPPEIPFPEIGAGGLAALASGRPRSSTCNTPRPSSCCSSPASTS